MEEIAKEIKIYSLNYIKMLNWKNIYNKYGRQRGKRLCSHTVGETVIDTIFLESSVLISIKTLKDALL